MISNTLKLLDWLPGRSAVVIRHAERFDIRSPGEYWTCGLTPEGMRQAWNFGLAIAGHFDSCSLFHSPVRRCLETAEGIVMGLSESGKEVISREPEELLGVSYILVEILDGFLEADRFGDGFIRAWFDGRVDPGIFMPLHDAKAEHLEYLRDKFSAVDSDRHLDIHVTHDWNINVLREGIFGLRHEEAGWPDFLSGLGFSCNPLRAAVPDENGQVIWTDIR